MGKGGERNSEPERNYEIYKNDLLYRMSRMRGIEIELDELYINFRTALARTLTVNNAINNSGIEVKLRDILRRRGNSGNFTRNELKNLLNV